MEIKFKGFDQITAWIGGIGISAIIFTGVWYTGKNIHKNIAATDSARVEQAEKDVAKFASESQRQLAEKASAQAEFTQEKSTETMTPGKPSSTLESWGYAGNLAPWYWSSLNENWSECGKKINQSPIDISGSKPDERLKTLKFSFVHGVTHLTLHHETVQGDVERGSYLDWDGERFDLTRVFFRTPSEHRVNSLPWEMEVQLEHKNASGKTIMIAVLVTPGKPSKIIDQLAENLPRFKDDIQDHERLNWLDLFPSKRTYWTYIGSGTMPPCEPNVTWIVMTEPVTASKKTIDKYVTIQKTNVRPVYSLGKRQLARSNR